MIATVAIIFLCSLILIAMRFIGLFNKKISRLTDMIIILIRSIEISWKTFWGLPKKIALLTRLWLKRRRLLVLILKRDAIKRLRAQHAIREDNLNKEN